MPGIFLSYSMTIVPQKSKSIGKAFVASKPSGKKSTCIRLDDLMPRKTVTGGVRLLFGASHSNQTKKTGDPA
jgi:hypothetical protein